MQQSAGRPNFGRGYTRALRSVRYARCEDGHRNDEVPQTTGAFSECNEARGYRRQAKHSIQHHIETTPVSPVICRLRRLAPERLAVAKAEIQKLMDSGIIRPSKSN